MTVRRPLHRTLADLAGGLLDAAGGGPLRTRSVELTLPIDIRLPGPGGELTGDLPLFRLRTDFDPAPARLRIVLGEQAP